MRLEPCVAHDYSKISLTDAVTKIVKECDRRGMRPPYTFSFTTPDGKEMEVVPVDDLNDMPKTKLRGKRPFTTAITVTVQDRDGRTMAGVIEASKAN